MNIKEELEKRTTNIKAIKLNKSEKLILSICFKSAKSTSAISRLLNLTRQTVSNYLSALNKTELIRKIKSRSKRGGHDYFYIFDGTDEQLIKCPQDVKDYINEYWRK